MKDFIKEVFDREWQKVFASSSAGSLFSMPVSFWVAAIPAALGSIYTLLRIVKYVRDWNKPGKD